MSLPGVIEILTHIAVFLAFLAIGELFAWFAFGLLRSRMKEQSNDPQRRLAIVKGLLERPVVACGLVNGFPQVIIAFGALKIATRLHDEKQDVEIANDYFLMGNFISLLIAIPAAANHRNAEL